MEPWTPSQIAAMTKLQVIDDLNLDGLEPAPSPFIPKLEEAETKKEDLDLPVFNIVD